MPTLLSVGDTLYSPDAAAIAAGYVTNPGEIIAISGDGTTTILWADGFSMSVYTPMDSAFAELQMSDPFPP